MTPQQKYSQTEKGKAARKLARERYRKTDIGKSKQAVWSNEYNSTPEGKSARAKHDAARYERKMKKLHGADYVVGDPVNRRSKSVCVEKQPLRTEHKPGITIHRLL
jgi:hypothetical protein